MKRISCIAFVLSVALRAAAAAQTAAADCPQHQAHVPPPVAGEPAGHEHAMSPYAGREGSEIKALSAEEIKAYREGTGMGLAKPAELNHYPGPRHVLDLAAELELTAEQSAELKTVFDRMHSSAVALGDQIIAREKALDRAFASGTIDSRTLADLTAGIGSLQAELRAAHLKAHLETKRILTAPQNVRYDALRGYTPAAKPPSAGRHSPEFRH